MHVMSSHTCFCSASNSWQISGTAKVISLKITLFLFLHLPPLPLRWPVWTRSLLTVTASGVFFSWKEFALCQGLCSDPSQHEQYPQGSARSLKSWKWGPGWRGWPAVPVEMSISCSNRTQGVTFHISWLLRSSSAATFTVTLSPCTVGWMGEGPRRALSALRQGVSEFRPRREASTAQDLRGEDKGVSGIVESHLTLGGGYQSVHTGGAAACNEGGGGVESIFSLEKGWEASTMSQKIKKHFRVAASKKTTRLYKVIYIHKCLWSRITTERMEL